MFANAGLTPTTKARGSTPISVNTPGAVLFIPKCEGVDVVLAEGVLAEARRGASQG